MNSTALQMKLKSHHKVFESEVVRRIASVVEQRGEEAYLIGGFVRDTLLGREVKDIDVVTVADGVHLAQAVALELGHTKVRIFKTYGTAMLREGNWELEFVGARKESYSSHSRKPHVSPGSLYDDQLRRDFTINALGIALGGAKRGELVDPFQGLEDLRRGIIRTPAEPATTFSDDPLRMMRAIRFASQLGFTIAPDTLQAIGTMQERLHIVSIERISAELNKIMLSPKPSIGFKLLFDTGLLHQFFPELVALQGVEERAGQRHKDNFYHTLQVLDNVARYSDKLWLRWAALLHDIAKPATRRFSPEHGWTFHGHEDKGARMVPAIFKRLKLPLDQHMRYVQKLVALHLRPIALTKEHATDSAIRRLLFDAGEDIDDLMLLCRCDITSKNEQRVRRYLINYEKVKEKLVEVEEKDRLRKWQPPISGEEIMQAFDLKPSREVGLIKNAIKEAILDGVIGNVRAEAWQYMLQEGRKLGLRPVAQSSSTSTPRQKAT